MGPIEGALILLLIWMFFELVRPPQAFRLPILISLVSVFLWMQRGQKQLGRAGTWWFVLLADMAIMIPFAANNFSVYFQTRLMAVLFLTHCLPLQSVLRRPRHVRMWVVTFLGIATYIGIWAVFHGGYGPAGAAGAQDENYVAALMTMALPFAYFLLLTQERWIPRLLLLSCILVFIAAIALAANPSRGGFLALCTVGAYVIFRSPRRGLAVGVLSLAALALALIAGPSFWAEIQNTTDVSTDSTGGLRLRAWTAGLNMWFHHPIFGVGAGNFPWQLGAFESAGSVQELGRSLGGMAAHSMWVELLADLGLVGVVSFLALLWSAWSGAERVIRKAGRLARWSSVRSDLLQLRAVAFAVQGAILAASVSGIFLSILYYAHIWILFAVGNALPFVLARIERAEAPPMADILASPSAVRRHP